MKAKAVTLVELLASIMLVSMIFLILSSVLFFLVRRMVGYQRTEDLKIEMLLIVSQLEDDLVFNSVGSSLNDHNGLIVCSACPSFVCGPSVKLALRKEVDKEASTLDDEWVTYRYGLNGILERCDEGRCSILSRQVVDFTVYPYPTGAPCGQYFTISINLTMRFNPNEPSNSYNNPEVSQTFMLAAHQLSVR